MPDAQVVAATWSRPLEAAGACPPRADVVIIGGGIVGITTAWFLVKRGIATVVCEKGHIAGEQSGRNWGWVRAQGRDPRELPMMLDSRQVWKTLDAEIGEQTGYTEGGCLFTARNDSDMERLTRWCDVGRDFGMTTKMLSRSELESQVGDAARHWMGAMYTADDGRAEPHLTTPAIARAAKREGATILTGCAVRGLLRETGRCAGVVTERGEIRTSTVLCSAGAWTSLFLRALDIPLPQLRVRGTVARVSAADIPLDGNLFDDKIGIRRRADGGFNVAHGSILHHSITPTTLRHATKFLPALKKEIGVLKIRFGKEFFTELATPRAWPLDEPSPFEQTRVLNPEPCAKTLGKMRANMAEVFPALGAARIEESWAGMVETTPDVVPVIGEEQDLPGLFVATGFSGHGFGLGPGAARSIAALVAGDAPPVDLIPFRRDRFYDGSPIRPYTEL